MNTLIHANSGKRFCEKYKQSTANKNPLEKQIVRSSKQTESIHAEVKQLISLTNHIPKIVNMAGLDEEETENLESPMLSLRSHSWQS